MFLTFFCFSIGAHWEMNATWTGLNEARLEIRSEVEIGSYHLFVRKVNYNATNFVTYGKWKGGVQSRENNEDVNTQGLSLACSRLRCSRVIPREGNPRYTTTAVVYLRLDQDYTWEVRIVMKNDTNKSATIFIDPPMLRATGKQRRIC